MTVRKDGFVLALRDDPEDDTSLLVFADLLDERDDPRGELLRIQHELSHWVPDLERRQQLGQRERDLLTNLEDSWLGPLLPYCLDHRRQRGLAHLSMQARRFAGVHFGASAPGWLRHGWVGGIRLQGGTDSLRHALLSGVALEEVAGLDLSRNQLDDHLFTALLESPYLDNLRRLDLSNNRLTDRAALDLARSPLLLRLRELDLHNNLLTGAGVGALLRFGDPAQLRQLCIHGNDLDPSAMEVLFGWRQHQPGPPRRRINSLGMEFVEIPAGTFLMGSPDDEESRYDDEGPRHAVTLTRPFWLGVFEVTQQQFQTVLGSNPSHFTASRRGGSHHPVDSMTWEEAAAFCQRLAELPGERALGYTYRLPTEAEWEHACRAGTTTPFFPGATLSSRQANFDGNYPYSAGPRGPYRSRTTPVGSYPPNAFGLYDMHGNLWECCRDWYDENYFARGETIDPVGRVPTDQHVLRGGAWYNNAGSCRSAYRFYLSADERDSHVGFRAVLVPQ